LVGAEAFCRRGMVKSALTSIYETSLALLTDLYQLTMPPGSWKTSRSEQEAVFHLCFRKNPFEVGYTIAAGLEYALEYLKRFRFFKEDISYFDGLEGNDVVPCLPVISTVSAGATAGSGARFAKCLRPDNHHLVKLKLQGTGGGPPPAIRPVK